MSGNQVLGFAVRAVNEAGGTLREIAGDLSNVERAADGIGRSLGAASDVLGSLGGVFGDQVGQLGDYAEAAQAVAVGVESLIEDGPAVLKFLLQLPAMLGPAIASTWAYVTALYAQAAAFIAANAPILIIIGSLALVAAGIYLLIKYWDDLKEKFPILQELEDKVKAALGGAVQFIKDDVIPPLQWIYEKGLQPVLDFARDHWPLIATLLSGPFAPLVLLATDAFGVRSKLEGAFQGAMNWMRDTWKDVKGYITAPFDALADAATSGFGIPGLVETAFDGMVSTIVGVLNGLIDTYNNTLGRVPGVPNIPRIGGGGGGGSQQGYDPNDPTGQRYGGGGSWEAGIEGLAGGAGGGSVDGFSVLPTRSPGGMGLPSVNYIDPRGYTYTANEILGIRDSNGGQVGLTIMALDARSFEDWLNRGGGDVLVEHLNRRRAA